MAGYQITNDFGNGEYEVRLDDGSTFLVNQDTLNQMPSQQEAQVQSALASIPEPPQPTLPPQQSPMAALPMAVPSMREPPPYQQQRDAEAAAQWATTPGDTAAPSDASKPQITMVNGYSDPNAQPERPDPFAFVSSGGRGSPARWEPTTRSTSGISNEQQQGLVEAQQQATQSQLRALQKQAQRAETAYEADIQESLVREGNARQQAFELERPLREMQASVDAKREQLRSKDEELRQMEPTSFYDDIGFAGTIMAAVALAAGQYAQGMGAGPNGAAGVINQLISSHARKQEAQMADAKSDQKSRWDDFLTNVAPGAEAKRLEREMWLSRAVEEQLKREKIHSDYGAGNDVLDASIAAAAQNAVDKQAQLMQLVQRNETEKFRPATSGGSSPLGQLKQAAQAQGYLDQIYGKRGEDAAADKDAVFINGKVVGKRADAQEINGKIEAAQELKALADEMIRIHREGGWKDNAQFEALREKAGFVVANANKFRIGSEEDNEKVYRMVGRSRDAWTREDERRLQSTVDTTVSGVNNMLSNRQLPTLTFDKALPNDPNAR